MIRKGCVQEGNILFIDLLPLRNSRATAKIQVNYNVFVGCCRNRSHRIGVVAFAFQGYACAGNSAYRCAARAAWHPYH
ncbi:hypothetical protein AGR13a_Cc250159 [Agrobacterium genomosp. 13 str. CFBP 6927]|uniref:Uncharacterized protein n=1 Tax=Agrobacterium genomosp. 13 str. CFBP 6927 TaxID=1183428 RepID=A0ABP2BJD9_9HYPH|nr:hypothetical protein AGR13a_Cc250159 [Agrobacterium genomosp. 13 str. CFBP 6927]